MKRGSAVRCDMVIGLEPINQSKLRRSGMEISSLFVPLLWSWAGWETDFAVSMSRLTALSIRRCARLGFQERQATNGRVAIAFARLILLFLFATSVTKADSPKVWEEFSGEKAFAHVERL